jgi:hypothetical protein
VLAEKKITAGAVALAIRFQTLPENSTGRDQSENAPPALFSLLNDSFG